MNFFLDTINKFVQCKLKHHHLRLEGDVFYNDNRYKNFEKQNIIFDDYLESRAMIAFMHLTQKAIRWPRRWKLRRHLQWLLERLIRSGSYCADKLFKAYGGVLHSKGGLS